MSGQARLFNVCSVHQGGDCEYRHGFCEKIDPHRVVLPREYVGLRTIMDFAEACFGHDANVGWRVWWVLLYDEVHHKLLRLDSDFTGHQEELGIRHIVTGLSRWEYVDQGGSPRDILDPEQWMMGREQIKLAYYRLCNSNVAKFGEAERLFLYTWSCLI